MYQALYRKWRPKTFADVVGQQHITETLKNEIAHNRVAHAYLFTGSRGTGKTTCAKILAKAVNCLNPQDCEPCGECDSCRGIDDGSLLDVSEIDAASNNGVDNIRDLREEASFTPAQAKYRVYIIDEVHMLSSGAFNALLKIMEEPPPHVLFILATTEVHKIPATILSRCQRFDFKRIQPEHIAARLAYIAEKEGASLTDEAALLIARVADGGMRDAISLLDICLSQNREVTAEIVSKAAGLADTAYVFELAGCMMQGDSAGVLTLIDKLYQLSADMGRLCDQMVGHYRNLLIVKSVREPEKLLVCSGDDLKKLREQAEKCRLEDILFALNTLQATLDKLSKSVNRRVELEISFLTLCQPKLAGTYEALNQRLARLEERFNSGSFAAPSKEPSDSKQTAEQAILPDEKPEPSEELFPVPPDVPEPEIAEAVKLPRLSCWVEVLQKLSSTNGALHGALINSSAYVQGDLVLIEAKDGLFAAIMRQNEYAKESLREAIRSVTGQTYRLGPYSRKNRSAVAKPKKSAAEEFVDLARRLDIEVIENE